MYSPGDRFVVCVDAPSAIRYRQHPHSGGVGPGRHRRCLVRDESRVRLSLPAGNCGIHRPDDLCFHYAVFPASEPGGGGLHRPGCTHRVFRQSRPCGQYSDHCLPGLPYGQDHQVAGDWPDASNGSGRGCCWFSGAGLVPDTCSAGGRTGCLPGRPLRPDQAGP